MRQPHILKDLLQAICILATCLTITSCAQDECTEIAVVNARVSFFNAENTEELTTLDTLSVVGLNNLGHPLDTILYNKKNSIDHILLPLRKDEKRTRYLFIYHLENNIQETDTLLIRHENTPYVISPECGCIMFHSIQSIEATHQQIRDSKIVNSQISNKDEIHIALFY